MSTPTDSRDPGDAAVVSLLRRAGLEAPVPGATPYALDVDALLRRSRRSARRHQLVGVAGGAAAAAAVAVLAVALTTGHPSPTPVPAGPTSSSTPSAPSTPSTSATSAGTDTAVAEALGPGWVLQLEEHQGVFSVRPGSPTAATVPQGWTVNGQVSLFGPADTPLHEMCQPLQEKGYTFEGCTPVTAPDGTPLLRRVQSGGGEGGTSSMVRIFHELGGGRTRIVDVTLYHPGTVSAAQLAAADGWVTEQEPLVRRAAALGAP